MASPRPVIATNISYGTGPYLRIMELALAINDEFQRQGYQRRKILLPHLYGKKQERILQEEFGDVLRERPNELILDESYGSLLRNAFYENEPFPTYLDRWTTTVDQWSREASAYLQDVYGDAIEFELSRAPRIDLDLNPSFYTSFGFVSRVYSKARAIEGTPIDQQLLAAASSKLQEVESKYDRRFISMPGSFPSQSIGDGRKISGTTVPPLIRLPRGIKKPPTIDTRRGLYVTVSGIPGIEDLYADATQYNYTIYTNDPDALGFGEYAKPSILSNEYIHFHFARAGWGSIWLSLLTDTPLLIPTWRPTDDPEIFFNIKKVLKLGIGSVYDSDHSLIRSINRGQIIEKMQTVKRNIRNKYTTLDGLTVTAGEITQEIIGQTIENA